MEHHAAPHPRSIRGTGPKRHAGGDARTLCPRTARLPTALCTAAAHLMVGACLALDASPGCLEACCYLLSPAKDAQSGGHRLRPDWSTDARPLGLSHGRSQKRGRGGRGRSPERSREEPRDRRDHKRHPRGDQRAARRVFRRVRKTAGLGRRRARGAGRARRQRPPDVPEEAGAQLGVRRPSEKLERSRGSARLAEHPQVRRAASSRSSAAS